MRFFEELLKKHKERRDQQYQNVLYDFADLSGSIKYLIKYRSKKYAIFIDREKEFDWETHDNIDEVMSSKKMNSILSGIEHLQHQPCVEYFSYNQKKGLYCLLGECLAYAIDEDYSTSRKVLNKAEQYLNDRKYEITRKWQLSYAIGILGISIIVFLLLNRHLGGICVFLNLQESEFSKMLLLFWGVVGAVFSIIQNTGNTFYDCQSGRFLSFLQIFSKILAGIISSIFIIYLYELGLIFSSLGGNNQTACLTAMCIISGFSERLVPSIINKICKDETTEEENEQKGTDNI